MTTNVKLASRGLACLCMALLWTYSIRSQCTTPSALSYTAPSATSATISWTSPGSTTWVVEYGPAGFSQGTGTLLPTTSTSVTISGLTQNLIYDFYVKGSCGPGNESAWSADEPFNGQMIPCDDFDGYSLGAPGVQSTLINDWAGAGGDAAISLDYSNSAPSSLKIYDSGPNVFSDVVAEVGTYTSGIHNVEFDVYVPVTYGGYYNILHNYVGVGTNVWAIEVYLDSNGTATVQGGTNSTATLGTYNYNVGQWNNIQHIIDLDNDTAFIIVNGQFTTVGWQFSLGSTNFGDQFNAVNFYSAANLGQTPLCYFDNFCVTDAPVDDIGMIQYLVNPPVCGDTSYGVPVVIRNFAMNNQSNFPVNLSYTGTSTGATSFTYTDILRPGEYDTIELGNINNQSGGAWSFLAGTALSGDNQPANDTLSSGSLAFIPGVSAEFGPPLVTYCEFENFSLSLNVQNTGATYAWNTGSTAASLTADTAGTYAVTVTGSNGCTATDQVDIIEIDAFDVDLGDDMAVCQGDPIAFFLNPGSGAVSYTWSTGDTVQIIPVNSAGVYSVSVENSLGCVTVDTIEFIENPLPTVTLFDLEVCGGDTAILDAGNPGFLYDWSEPGEFDQTLAVVQSGTYTVVVTDGNGCSSEDSATVTVNINPFVLLGNDTTIVVGGTVTLDAGFPGADYDWSTGENTQTIQVSSAATYTVTVTDENGCQGTGEIVVDVKVGIASIGDGSIKLHPNPATSGATLTLDGIRGNTLKAELFTASGQRVQSYENQLNAGAVELPLDLTNLSHGIYMVVISIDDKPVQTLRLVRQ